MQSRAARFLRDAAIRRAPIYSSITISGDDRIAFLQGQLTQDVSRLTAEPGLAAAWCSPKGRVLVTLRLIEREGAIGLVLPAAAADEAKRRLELYRLRAKVGIEAGGDLLVAAFDAELHGRRLSAAHALPGGDPLATAAGAGLVSIRLATGAVEVYGSGSAFADAGLDPGAGLPDEAWQRARILTGLVDIGPANAERFTPHMLNLDCIGALSFEKGCYTGQEVVARTEHLGRVKRRVNLYRLEGAELAPGDRLRDGDTDVAEVVNAAGDVALAVGPFARRSETLTAAAGRARPMPLPYPVE